VAEQLVLTVAITHPSQTLWRVSRIVLDRSNARIHIRVVGNNGEQKEWVYDGAVALTLMNQLNTMDLTVQSLEKRILNRLVIDGVLSAGTITGTPD
jgi:hypothetical protein